MDRLRELCVEIRFRGKIPVDFSLLKGDGRVAVVEDRGRKM